MQCYISPNLMKKQTHLDGLRVRIFSIWVNSSSFKACQTWVMTDKTTEILSWNVCLIQMLLNTFLLHCGWYKPIFLMSQVLAPGVHQAPFRRRLLLPGAHRAQRCHGLRRGKHPRALEIRTGLRWEQRTWWGAWKHTSVTSLIIKKKTQLLRHLWQLAPLSDIVLILYLSLAVYEPWSVLVFTEEEIMRRLFDPLLIL